MTVERASTRANRINSDSLDWSYISISSMVGHSTSVRRARGRSTADTPPPLRRSIALRYNYSYTQADETAISIPNEIFEQAERLAKTRGWSRSELYANAVSAFVHSERFSGVREKLDTVYGEGADDSAVEPLLAAAPGNVRLFRRVSSLPHDSVVNVSQLITLDKSLLTKKVSRLPEESFREVEAGIKLVLAL